MTWVKTSIYTQNCASNQNRWKNRAPILAQNILESDASFVTCQELYAAQRPLLAALIASKYELGVAKYGRTIFYRKGRWKPHGQEWVKRLRPNGKTTVGRTFKHYKGAILNVTNSHFTWETTKKGDEARALETRHLVIDAQVRFKTEAIVHAGDFNSPAEATTRRDVVGEWMTKAGYKDVGLDVKPKTGKHNYHLDRVFGYKTLTKGYKVKIVQHNGSDHPGIFVKLKFRK